MKHNRPIEGDDGRTVAPMNIDGMPGYVPGRKGRKPPSPYGEEDPLYDPKARRAMYKSVFKASALVMAVYAVVFTLLILFCTLVWFK
ncbi:MAG: hypothetical protein IJC61_01250 [Oscillospiraceae bacterium]|nr:hypothetical protein [Oscillospiraceae bacterium]MBQ9960021.1 hypothetical protein [Oscillospiraceae bacterium]